MVPKEDSGIVKRLVLVLALIMLSFASLQVAPYANPASPTPTIRLPQDPIPAAESNPLIDLVGIVAIVVVAGAGLYIYRVIRKGL